MMDVLLDFLKGIAGMAGVALLIYIYGRIKSMDYFEEQHPEWPRGLSRKNKVQTLFGRDDSN